MFTEELIKIGLTQNEAKVYNALILNGQTKAGSIIKTTKLHRNIVYENLNKLIEKGLVSFIKESKITLYKAQPPITLQDYINKQKRELEKKSELTKKLTIEINKLKPKKDQTQASMYKGKKGLLLAFKQIYDLKQDYYVLGAPKQSVESMPPNYWQNYNRKMKQQKTKVHMIFNESLRSWSKNVNFLLLGTIKFLPKQFDPLTSFNILKNHVFIIVWSAEPIVTVIQDNNVAKSYKQYFDYLWKIAKK